MLVIFVPRSCAVNNYTTPGKKRLAMEFCAYTASREESTLRVIKNATIAPDGSDPFRSSHLNIGEWLDQGYEPASTSEYFANIQESLTSVNCVTDIRFPSGSEIYAVLDQGMIVCVGNKYEIHVQAIFLLGFMIWS